jgi:hypothetical protein
MAEAVPAVRLPEPERLTTLDEEPGGFRSLARVFRPHGGTATPDTQVTSAPSAADSASPTPGATANEHGDLAG